MTAVCVMAVKARTQVDLFPKAQTWTKENTAEKRRKYFYVKIIYCQYSYDDKYKYICNPAQTALNGVYVFMRTSTYAHLNCVKRACIIYSENKSSLDIFLDVHDFITHSFGESCEWNTSIISMGLH